MTSKTLHGVVNGKTIELSDDPGVPTGQAVEVIVKTLPTDQRPWGEGLRACAGALADEWTVEDDQILEKFYQERNQGSPRKIPEG